MSKSTRSLSLSSFVLVCVLLGAVSAHAGNIVVTPTRGAGLVRLPTLGTEELIVCQISGTASGLTVECGAYSGGEEVECITSNFNMVLAAFAITANSFIEFHTDGAGTCTKLEITNGVGENQADL